MDILNINETQKQILKKLGIKTLEDLLEYYPYKYVSEIKLNNLNEINNDLVGNIVIISGTFNNFKINETKKYLQADFNDKNGNKIKILWFKKIDKVKQWFKENLTYTIKGELEKYKNDYSIVHPQKTKESIYNEIVPYYYTSEEAKKHSINNKFFIKLFSQILPSNIIEEIIPENILNKYKLIPRDEAIRKIHTPRTEKDVITAKRRLKFEELFLLELKILQSKNKKKTNLGFIFKKTNLLKDFYENILTFDLTDAQKRVIKEIYSDFQKGKQMNRLLQGDVGSGKTIVAFISILIAISNKYQCIFIAPTEILAEQHYKNFNNFCEKLNINIDLLTGSTKQKDRKNILEKIKNGSSQFVVGTHSLLNKEINFKKLGYVVIDEQHKFGVMQRGVFLEKYKKKLPHVLLMSATPIPRTLALILYGDYDMSTIDELPKNRKPVKTFHYYESQRLKLFGFIKKKIEQEEQIYFVYPIIEESKTLDLKNAVEGYEAISKYFSDVHVGIIHGEMSQKNKDLEMSYFKKGFTKILVATTVIEVGIDIPNATVMVIEDAERFGLAQLHQLRGRVGRGNNESFCFLITKFKLSNKQREKINAMVKYNNGFELANIDLKIRGSGNIFGEEQSGNIKLKLANLNEDIKILECAKIEAEIISPLLNKYPLLKKKILGENDVCLANIG